MNTNSSCRRGRALLLPIACAGCLLGLASAARAAGNPWSTFRWQSIGLASSGWMRSIAADPNDENVLWAVADMGGGIVYTTNGGRSWTDVMANAIRDTKQASFLRVYVHPKERPI